MADKVLFQDTDDLSETNLSEVLALKNISGYVDRGLGFTADFVNNTLTIATGHAIVEDSNAAYHLFPDERTGLSLTDAATNHVFITHDPTVDEDISYHIDTDDSPPSNPSLKVGTVDTSADTTTELNRDAPVDYRTRTVSSDYTTNDEDVIYVDESGGAVTVTLASADATNGNEIEVVNISGSNTVTVNTEAAETIDGGSSDTLTSAAEPEQYVSDGSNWSTFTPGGFEIQEIDSGSTTTHTTQGEDLIVVDTSSAGVTVTLASADATQNNSIEFRLVDGSNALTIDTEGAETIDPGGASSITVSKAGWTRVLSSDGSNWDADRDAEFNSVTTEQATIGGRRTLEHIETATPSSGSISITGISGYDIYVVEYELQGDGNTGDFILRLNGDGASTGNYDYYDESATASTVQNEVVLATASDTFSEAGGELYFPKRIGQLSFDNRFTGRVSDISGWADWATRESASDLSEIEITTSGTLGFNSGEARLYGAVR